jgi:hypothetical protein
MDPVGISFEFSWMRTFCQSLNLDCSMDSCHALRLLQVMLGQTLGSVYLNCCSTSRIEVRHSWQTKVPKTSSGRTSEVRVTVPEMETSWPIFSVRRSRMPETCARVSEH